jgi:hypothetical protein
VKDTGSVGLCFSKSSNRVNSAASLMPFLHAGWDMTLKNGHNDSV